MKSSATTRLTIPVNELAQQVQAAGWMLGKVDWDNSLGQFYAEAENPHADKIRKTGPDEAMALGNLVEAIYRHNHMRTAAQWKVGMWNTDFHDQAGAIAEAYAKAPAYDPKAAPYWKELGDDSLRRLETLQRHIQFEPTHHPVPYLNPQEMLDDVYKKKRYQFSTANLDHPIWSAEQAAAFRAVHDILGRAVGGGGFGLAGATRAFAAHAPLLSPTAQAALFTEAVARPAFRHTYHQPDVGKIATFPQFIEEAQAKENKPGHRGIHPSQSIVPYQAPGTLSKVAGSAFVDPNKGWESGVEPGFPNAYMHHGDPLQANEVMDNASKIDTNWSGLMKPDGTPDTNQMKLAIVNAFRVVLLSPRKDLRWNAIHYQDISGIPADAEDPKTYWDTLESKRRAWNSAQGIAEDAHMIYYPYIKPFESVMWQMHPELGFEGAQKKAKEVLFDWWTEEQERIEAEDKERPADKQKTADEIERRANEALARRLKGYLKDKTDPKVDVYNHEPMSLFGKTGGQTPNQYKRQMRELEERYGPAQLQTVHQFDNGWSVAKPSGNQKQQVKDINRIGELMKNCWQDKVTGSDDKHVLLDEHGIPRVAWQTSVAHAVNPGRVTQPEVDSFAPVIRTDAYGPRGHNNSEIKPEHWDMIRDWAAAQNPPVQQWRVDPNSPPDQYRHGGYSLGEPGPESHYWNFEGRLTPRTAAAEDDILGMLGLDHLNFLTQPSKPKPERKVPTAEEALEYDKSHWPNEPEHMMNLAEHVPTEVLQQFREYDRAPGGRDAMPDNRQRWEALKEHIQRYGINSPVFIDWNQDTGAGHISEGNHRVQLASEIGLSHVPTIIYRSGRSSDTAVPMTHQDPSQYEGYPPGSIHYPQYMKPSEFGLPVRQDKTAAGGQYNLLTGEEALKYGAFMGTHLKAIGQISQHADELLQAALEDVRNHDGAGHHFRAATLQLGISGVGPKVCSFAWLLLQPMTSQLATIDTHMMDVLGHNYEKEMSNRDYFKFERELAAGRDSAGYNHIPLGTFQWGMWDHKRTGEGSHQDHSAMRVLDPVPHANIDWVGKAQNLKGDSWLQQAPDWWKNTQEARDAVANQWDGTVAANFPKGQVPYQTVEQPVTAKRETRMSRLRRNTGLSTAEIWAQYA